VTDGRNRGGDAVYDEAEIGRRLAAELPSWRLETGCIQRRFETGGWKATLMVVNAIGHLAEVAFHHPEITASYGAVIVRLSTHSANGVTTKDFELARKIEEIVTWQPGLDDQTSLEGIPDDPCLRYLTYD
jgi:4a-hydroxytetrahydrobiopterin dehydratase